MSNRPHGYARYRLDNCRCDICRKAVQKYDRQQVINRANGRPATVDAEPIRKHVRSLQAEGIGLRRIAETSGVRRQTLQVLLAGRTYCNHPPSRRVRAATAEKLLAVTVETARQRRTVDAIGTRRRLQALVAIGWTQEHLANVGDLGRASVARITRGTNVVVTVDLAQRVAALYRSLHYRLPPETTRSERRSALLARRFAADRGWVPPTAWTRVTIDDPTAHPIRIPAEGVA